MNEKLRNQYDSLYTNQKNVFGGGKPVEVVKRLENYLPKGSVLDLGGGEGRNALYLASRGFDVTVYDFSEVAIQNLHVFAAEQHVSIKTKVVDLLDTDIEREFDSIILTFVLHHMNSLDAKALIRKAQAHTAAGGVNILSTFSNQGGLYDRNQNNDRFYPSELDIRALYADWDIAVLDSEDILAHAKDKSGNRMKNEALSLIAIKK